MNIHEHSWTFMINFSWVWFGFHCSSATAHYTWRYQLLEIFLTTMQTTRLSFESVQSIDDYEAVV